LASFWLVGLFCWHYHRHNTNEESKYLKELLQEFKSRHLAKLYYLWFVLRRLLIIIVVVCFNEIDVYMRLFIYLSLQIAFLLYSISVRPFNSLQGSLTDILNDSIYILGTWVVIAFQNEEYRHSGEGSFLIYMLIANWMMICAINCVCLVYNIVKFYKKMSKVQDSNTQSITVNIINPMKNNSLILAPGRIEKSAKIINSPTNSGMISKNSMNNSWNPLGSSLVSRSKSVFW